MAPTSKLLKLPDRGWLLVASDLHGNLRDFLTIVALFERRQREDSGGYLLFLGDLVHGPYLPLEEWEDVGAMPYLRGHVSLIAQHVLAYHWGTHLWAPNHTMHLR